MEGRRSGRAAGRRRATATLHIEHAVRDSAEWQDVFDRFGDTRREGGVRG
ncbi:hypothetical protein [Streptomyces solincola]|nr:hypothetical protein [Streptomyces solincola]